MDIPWAKIKAEWLKGGKTHQQLADKYGVKVKTIRNRASKEGWRKAKGKIEEKTEEELCARVTRVRVNHLEKLIQANDQLIEGLLELTQQIQKKPVTSLFDAQGGLRNAESVAKAIRTAVETQRDLHSLKTIDQSLANRKWLAEQREKKAAAKESAGTVFRIETEEEEPLDE